MIVVIVVVGVAREDKRENKCDVVAVTRMRTRTTARYKIMNLIILLTLRLLACLSPARALLYQQICPISAIKMITIYNPPGLLWLGRNVRRSRGEVAHEI